MPARRRTYYLDIALDRRDVLVLVVFVLLLAAVHIAAGDGVRGALEGFSTVGRPKL